MKKSMSKNQVLFVLLVTLGLLMWALPRFWQNDLPTPPCVTTVWNEGLPSERVDEVCVMGEGE